MSSSKKTELVDPILPDAIYSKRQFMLRAQIGESCYRAARRAGLRVIEKHGRSWILGKHWLAYLEGES